MIFSISTTRKFHNVVRFKGRMYYGVYVKVPDKSNENWLFSPVQFETLCMSPQLALHETGVSPLDVLLTVGVGLGRLCVVTLFSEVGGDTHDVLDSDYAITVAILGRISCLVPLLTDYREVRDVDDAAPIEIETESRRRSRAGRRGRARSGGRRCSRAGRRRCARG
jgi:hypothetical protein